MPQVNQTPITLKLLKGERWPKSLDPLEVPRSTQRTKKPNGLRATKAARGKNRKKATKRS